MKEISGRHAWRELWLPVFIITSAALAVFSNTLGNSFVHSDYSEVMNNPWIRDVRFIPKIFSSNAVGFEGGIGNYYRPMLHVIHMLDYYLFGLMPWGYHLVNVLFHIGSSVLVFLIARILFREYEAPSKYFPVPLMAAVLFAVHPINTEAVAWIAGITDLSYTFFCLLSLYLYLRSEDRFNVVYYLSVVAFFMGTLCKEPALTLPALLLAYDLWLSKKKPGLSFILKRYALFAFAGIVYFGLRLHALGGVMKASEELQKPYKFYGNLFIIIVTCLKKLVMPFNLHHFYSFKPVQSMFEATTLLYVLLTALFAALFYVAYKRDRLVFFCLLVITVPLLPCLYTPGIAGDSPLAERYLYLPSAGFTMLVSLTTARFAESKGRIITASVFLVLVALFAAGTYLRNADWKDDYTLFSAELKKTGSADAYDVLRFAAERHINLGAVYEKQGRDDLAVEEYIVATKCNPNAADAFIAYKDLGNAYARLGKVDKSIQAFEEALKVKPDNAYYVPDYAGVHNNLGAEYARKGDVEKAIEHFQAAVRLNPADPMYKINLEMARKNR